MTKTVTQAVEELVRATVHLSDEDMGREWKWRDYDEEGLRFALLMTHHELRDLGVRLAARGRIAPTQAQRLLAQCHQAYRDLTGILAGARTEDLDRAPAKGEWPLRETLKHMLRAEHGFLARIRFALEHPPAPQRDAEGEAKFLTFRKDGYELPEDATAGPIESIRDRFFDIHRRVLTELADVSDAQLDIRSWFWESEPMPIRFRMHRIEEHLRQHTIQLDKTLAAIRPPTEAHRLVRNIYNALADVESASAPADDLRSPAAQTISDRASSIMV